MSIAGLFFLPICEHSSAAKRKKKTYTLTAIELQSMLMGYADRFNNTLINAFIQFNDAKPSTEARFYILNDMVYTQASIFTLAAEPNPEKALLDMVVVTALGRLTYQNNLQQRYEKPVGIMAEAYRQMDTDIWTIVSKILTKQQREELRSLILAYRRQNPDQLKFNLVRFSNFSVDLNKSTLVEKKEAGGLFKSVDKASAQIKQMRMVTERGMYLGTRLPLLIGNFSQAWVNESIRNPEVKKILDNLQTFSAVSERLAKAAEKLPGDVARERNVAIKQIMKEIDTLSQSTLDRVMAKVSLERQAAIDHLMDRFAIERQKGLEEIMAEEQRARGMVVELRKMLTEGNSLLVSANTLALNLNLDEAADAKPFDIQDYRDAVAEVSISAREFSTLIDKMDSLVSSDGWTNLLPQITNSIIRVENAGEEFVNHAFKMAIYLVLIWLSGYFVVRLMLLRYEKK